MTNLQDGASRQASQFQQRLLLGLPIGIGAVLAILLAGGVVIPQWLKLRSDSERLAQLQEIQARIPLLRTQIAKAAESQDAAERKQQKVLQLIEGSGDLVTFLAQLDQEAARFSVQLDLYEPVAALPPPAADGNNAEKGEQLAATPKPPLEAAGLKVQQVLLTARGTYPNVLTFLRATEKLSVLVSQSNLSLAAVEQPKPAVQPAAQDAKAAAGQAGNPSATVASGTAAAVAKTELKLMLTSYRSAGSVTSPPARQKT